MVRLKKDMSILYKKVWNIFQWNRSITRFLECLRFYCQGVPLLKGLDSHMLNGEMGLKFYMNDFTKNHCCLTNFTVTEWWDIAASSSLPNCLPKNKHFYKIFFNTNLNKDCNFIEVAILRETLVVLYMNKKTGFRWVSWIILGVHYLFPLWNFACTNHPMTCMHLNLSRHSWMSFTGKWLS